MMVIKNIYPLLFSLILLGCINENKETNNYESPNGDYIVSLTSNDLGACCSSFVSARLESKESGFGNLNEELFEVSGASDVRIEWLTPYQLEIRVCNAKNPLNRLSTIEIC